MADDIKIDFEPDNEPKAEELKVEESVTPKQAKEEKSVFDAILKSPLLKGAQIGSTLGFSDELAGAAGALGGKVGGDVRPVEDIYREARDEERARIAQARTESPRTVMAGELLGGAATLPFTGAPSIANTTGIAALGGLGTSSADLTKGELEQAALEAGTSGALGAILGGAGRYAPAATAAAGLGAAAGGLATGDATGMGIGAGLGVGALRTGNRLSSLLARLPTTQLGENIKRGFQLGREGESLIGSAPIKKAAGQVEQLAGETTQAIHGLESTEGAASRKTISDAVDTAISEVGTRLGKSGQDLVDFIQSNKQQIGQDIQKLLADKEAQGATIEVADIVGPLQKRLDDLVMALPEDIAAKENISKELNKYLIEQGLPVQLKTTRQFGPEGQLLTETTAVSGKGMPLEEVAARDIASQSGTVTPDRASLINKAAPDNEPLGSTQQEVSTFTPETQRGALPIAEANRLRRLMGQVGFGDKKAPEALKAELAKTYPELTERLATAFETPEGTNPLREANRRYTALSQAGDIAGEPIRDYLNSGAPIPSSSVQRLLTGIGKAAREGDKANYRRLMSTLSEVDPVQAKALDQAITQASGQEATLLKARTADPTKQLEALQAAGLDTQEHAAALQRVQDIDTIGSNLGVVTGSDTLDLPSQQTRNFIADIGNPIEGRQHIGRPEDISKTLGLLEKYRPELATKLRKEGSRAAEILRLTGELSKEKSGSPLQRVAGTITQIPVSLANVSGMASRKLEKGPISGTALRFLSKQLPEFSQDVSRLASEDPVQRQAALFTLMQRPDVREALDSGNIDFEGEE